MVHHWPVTVCKVSFSALTGPVHLVKPHAGWVSVPTFPRGPECHSLLDITDALRLLSLGRVS